MKTVEPPGKRETGQRRTLQETSLGTIDLRAPDTSVEIDRSDRVGETIGGVYRVRAVLGSGGMGTVYHAHDENLGRDVAIKLVHEERLALPGVREAFLEEARSMARVRHENVVAIHAFGTHGHQPYLVMEYVAGSNLAAWIAQRGQPSIADAMTMLDAICSGVEAIHATHAVHRDIKPGNIMLDEHGRVAVTDFGLSILHVDVDRSDSRFARGTPSYMAPEIARGEAIDPEKAAALDIYALGLIAFELLTGERPFEAETATEMLELHGSRTPPIPSTVKAGLPPAFDAPIMRALVKSPADRTRSAEVLRRDLQRAAAAAAEYPRGLKIVCVDDDADTLGAVRELLLMMFPAAEVITASDAATAIELVMHESPDIVITDFDMPGGGGAAITAAMRADPRTETVPIIVVTGRGGATDWSDLRALGADRFLMKPIDFDALAATIRRLVPPQS